MAGSVTGELQGRAQPDSAARRRLPAHHLLHAGDQLHLRELRPAGPPAGRRLGPARSRTPSSVSEDRLVLNIDNDGHLLVGGQVQPLNEAIQTIKHQADLVKLNLKVVRPQARRQARACPRPSSSGPTRTRLSLAVMSLINACQTQGFRKFALKAMTSS